MKYENSKKKLKNKKKKIIKKNLLNNNQSYRLIILKIISLIFLPIMIYHRDSIQLYNYINEEYIIDINELKYKHIIIPNLKDETTLVTSYFNLTSKFPENEYLNWINNFLQINQSMIFFIDRSYYKNIISKRPNYLKNKTIWIKLDIKDFYSYNNFYKEFNKTYGLDIEPKMHSIPLYLVRAEKAYFLKIAALKNYFQSKCFYWVDSGCFRDNITIKNYINEWPNPEKCYEDGRILMNEITQYTHSALNGLKNFNKEYHNNFQRFSNVDPSIFGGQKEYILKFCDLYYDLVKIYIKKEVFIGKERNIYAYIAYFNKKIVKLIYSGYYFYLQEYLSKNYNKRNIINKM